MTKRITIMVDEDVDKLLRYKQAKLIAKYQKSVSFSRVVNDAVRKSFK